MRYPIIYSEQINRNCSGWTCQRLHIINGCSPGEYAATRQPQGVRPYVMQKCTKYTKANPTLHPFRKGRFDGVWQIQGSLLGCIFLLFSEKKCSSLVDGKNLIFVVIFVIKNNCWSYLKMPKVHIKQVITCTKLGKLVIIWISTLNVKSETNCTVAYLCFQNI